MLSIAAILALTGCDSDDASSTTKTAGAVTASSMTADSGAYCERIASLEGERKPEAYVGSAVHRADIESLIEVAPEAVMAPLRTFAAFLASGAIVADDPESNVVENWPPDVQAAIGKIAAFNDASC